MIDIADILHRFAPYLPFISFFLLVLAGFNMPVSEDLVFIVSASIAATVVPESRVPIFLGCLLGAYAGDIIAYSLGRFAGRKILSLPFFSKRIPAARIERMEGYITRYGSLTIFAGRFIPFGVRNMVFLSAGIGGMSYPRFLLSDFPALCLTSAILFSLGYALGEKYRAIFPYLDRYKIVILGLLTAGLTAFFTVKLLRKRRSRMGMGPGDGDGESNSG